MRNIGERTKLILKARDVRSLGPRERLQCNQLVGFAIVGFIDHAHTARAEATANAKAFGTKKVVGALAHLLWSETMEREYVS